MAEDGSKKLSEAELYECLKRFNAPVRRSDLAAPTKEFIMQMFQFFLINFQIDINSASLRTWESLQHLPDGIDIYDNTLGLLLLTYSMNQILQRCGLDITIKDILEPKPKRTKKILNYLVVFFNYFLKKIALFRNLEEKYEEEQKKAVKLGDDVQSLERQFEDKCAILENWGDKEQLLQQLAESEAIVESYTQKKESIITQYQDLKARECELLRKLSDMDVGIVSCKEKLEEFDQLILSSPDRLTSELQTLKERNKEKESKIKEAEVKLSDKMKECTRVGSLRNALETREDLVVLQDNLSPLCQVFEKTVAVSQKIEEEDAEHQKQQLENNELEREIYSAEQKTLKANLNSTRQKEFLGEMFKSHEKNVTKVSGVVEHVKKAQSNLQQQLQSSESAVQDVVQKLSSEAAEAAERKLEFYSSLDNEQNVFCKDADETMSLLKENFS